MDSFVDFYRGSFHSLTLQLFAYTGDLAESQDLAQEAFCRAYARWRTVAGYEDPVGWVRHVAWNLATSRWRRLRVRADFLSRQREHHVAGPGPERVALVQALAKLSPAQRRIFVLHFIADLTIKDIARQEGIAEGTVKATLHRARTELAKRLGDQRKEGSDV